MTSLDDTQLTQLVHSVALSTKLREIREHRRSQEGDCWVMDILTEAIAELHRRDALVLPPNICLGRAIHDPGFRDILVVIKHEGLNPAIRARQAFSIAEVLSQVIGSL